MNDTTPPINTGFHHTRRHPLSLGGADWLCRGDVIYAVRPPFILPPSIHPSISSAHPLL